MFQYLIIGEVFKYVSFSFDVTSEYLSKQQLEYEKIKNIHMSRLSSIGEMAAGIAHEINNPLFVIDALLSKMQDDHEEYIKTNVDLSPTNLLEDINKSHYQVTRISKIIKGLKDFSRSGDDKPFSNVSTLDILDLVSGLCVEKLKNSQIHFELISLKETILCNQVQIEQILVNLINNSIDAIGNSENKWIKVIINKDSNHIYFRVVDSGNGIDAKILHNIMEPFFTTKPIGKGTGLGLSVSVGIAQSHHGDLYYELYNGNTSFVLKLPLKF